MTDGSEFTKRVLNDDMSCFRGIKNGAIWPSFFWRKSALIYCSFVRDSIITKLGWNFLKCAERLIDPECTLTVINNGYSVRKSSVYTYDISSCNLSQSYQFVKLSGTVLICTVGKPTNKWVSGTKSALFFPGKGVYQCFWLWDSFFFF